MVLAGSGTKYRGSKESSDCQFIILTPEPEPERINSARTSLVFESQYLDRLDARRAGEEFVGLCH
jgi:hypothetical protein